MCLKYITISRSSHRWLYFIFVCFVICFVLHCFPHCLVWVVQAPGCGHLSLILLVSAYENHSRKQPAPVADTFSASRGCPLTGASTVLWKLSHQHGIIHQRWKPWTRWPLKKVISPATCTRSPDCLTNFDIFYHNYWRWWCWWQPKLIFTCI